ncbi:MAG: hypothetical protein FWC95_06010 [Defluviitaleaceae bacterium]|nr:hypothetical protein [Defluviitaleaceae bacterium]
MPDINSFTKTFPFDKTKAAGYLRQWEDLCKKDSGKLWGVSLYVPFVIIDEETRDIVVNQDGFGDKFPEELVAGTTAIKHKDQFWATANWNAVERYGDDGTERMEMFVHEAFHALQPSLFGGETDFGSNAHLNELEARVLFLVEMSALLTAIKSSGEARFIAARSALYARMKRREKYGSMAEAPAELMEGTANYTQYMVVNPNAYIPYLENEVEKTQGDGIARNFGYFSGAMYCYVLDVFGVNWKPGLTWDSDLGEILSAEIGVPTEPTCFFDEKYKNIMGIEIKLQEEKDRKIYTIINNFTTRPILRCSLESDRGGTNMFIQLPNFGEIRRGVLQCSGAFGRMFVNSFDELMKVLQSDGEFDFLEHKDGYCAVFAEGLQNDGKKVTGAYWTMELNEGYEIVADGNNYEVRKI